MRIKEGVLPPENVRIRKDLNTFYYGGYDRSYLGVQCVVVDDKLPAANDRVYIEFISPISSRLLTYRMKNYEIEYLLESKKE